MKNGETVTAFERELASYCNARHAIAASNGTVTLQAALVAMGVKPGHRVAVPPLTMSATAIAVLNVGAIPVFVDVDPDTWIMQDGGEADWWLPVALYGLWGPIAGPKVVEDAAQTLRKHDGAAFTSLSFQASKVLSTGEGGALLTNDDELAARARSYLSLGYAMAPDQARIDPAALKSPTFNRHVQYPAINGRMNDVTAALGLRQLHRVGGLSFTFVDQAIEGRRMCAGMYARTTERCGWLVPQRIPEGWAHDWWTFAVACDTPERALWLADAIVWYGGERPFPAWRLTYKEPAFRHLNSPWKEIANGETVHAYPCPNAESLQPRLLQFQTNSLASAERNASALRKAIDEARH